MLERIAVWKIMLLVLVPATAVIILLGLDHALSQRALVGETIEQIDGPGYFGLVSNFAIAFWLLGGAAACLGAVVLWERSGVHREQALFLAGFGLWTLWLAWDDAYVMHESVFPLKLGISEHIVVVVYVLITAALLWRFRAQLINRDLPLLVIALALMATSEGIDQFIEGASHKYTEESFKFIGVWCWAAYFGVHVARLLRQRIAERTTENAVSD